MCHCSLLHRNILSKSVVQAHTCDNVWDTLEALKLNCFATTLSGNISWNSSGKLSRDANEKFEFAPQGIYLPLWLHLPITNALSWALQHQMCKVLVIFHLFWSHPLESFSSQNNQSLCWINAQCKGMRKTESTFCYGDKVIKSLSSGAKLDARGPVDFRSVEVPDYMRICKRW